jgi:hypothetical protein
MSITNKIKYTNRTAGHWPLFIIAAAIVGVFSSCNATGNKQETGSSTGIDRYNYVIGTQTIGPSYKFTEASSLVESAKRIREMGSNVLKICLKGKAYNIPTDAASPTELVQKDSSFKQVLDMDFAYYQLWVYKADSLSWRDGFTAEEKAAEYKVMFDLASYLLKTYDHSGKTFYLGHWEGDWHLLDGYNFNQEVVDTLRISGMIQWLNLRQQAVDDARAKTPHENVHIYNYTELNRPLFAMTKNLPRLVNKVLPFTNVDYVSYSSYDVVDTPSTYATLQPALTKVLDYIESNMKPKPSIKGKRVWIGEYGYPVKGFSPEEQDRRSRNVMRVALEWGCPFVLYNNEVENGKQVGYWMVDDQNKEQPVYTTHQRFYVAMKKWNRDFLEKNNRLPSPEEFSKEAVNILK